MMHGLAESAGPMPQTAATSLSAALLHFNGWPSASLHPSRHGRLAGAWTAPASSRRARALHRHWSQSLLAQLGLSEAAVLDTAASGLRLALLPGPTLVALANALGAVGYAAALRLVLDGSLWRELTERLGAAWVQFARGEALTVWQAQPAALAMPTQRTERLPATPAAWADAVTLYGGSLLCAAWAPAGPALVQRALLKLPDLPYAPGGLAAPEALALAEAVHEREAAWLSS